VIDFESKVEVLRRKGPPVGYFLFSGEQHGFLDAEFAFYRTETQDEWVLRGFSFANYLEELGAKAQQEIYEKVVRSISRSRTPSARCASS
jgi:hypothetical protein